MTYALSQLYPHNNSITHNFFTFLASCTQLLTNCTIKTINSLPLIVATEPIKPFNFLTSHDANCTNKKNSDFTWVACFITIHLLADLHRVNTHFLPLLKMTEVSRNVDIIKILWTFFFNFFYKLLALAIEFTDHFDPFTYFTILLYLHNGFFNPEFWPTFSSFR